MTSSLTTFYTFFIIKKKKRFHVSVSLFSNRSHMTSKCGKNISDTLGCTSRATFSFISHFEAICDLLRNRCKATWNSLVNQLATSTCTVQVAINFGACKLPEIPSWFPWDWTGNDTFQELAKVLVHPANCWAAYTTPSLSARETLVANPCLDSEPCWPKQIKQSKSQNSYIADKW